jgi:hypothetical protein
LALTSFSTILSGLLVFWVVTFLVLWFVIVACPFFVWIVMVGLKPMKEYWAIFCGPLIDSKRYAVWVCFWIWAKISGGVFLRVIFMVFKVLPGAVWAGVFVCLPKAIPHVHSSYGSEAYSDALFKAYQYKSVH